MVSLFMSPRVCKTNQLWGRQATRTTLLMLKAMRERNLCSQGTFFTNFTIKLNKYFIFFFMLFLGSVIPETIHKAAETYVVAGQEDVLAADICVAGYNWSYCLDCTWC